MDKISINVEITFCTIFTTKTNSLNGKIPEEIVFVNKYWQHDYILDNIKHRVELVHE